MGIEIERKFLVAGDGWTVEADGGTDLEQAYLSLDPDRIVRVRIAGTRGFLTIKGRGPSPDVRPEFEYEVPLEDAREMLEMSERPPVRKRRHLAAAAPGLTWEIDVFGGPLAGLVVAEIELPTADTPFPRPDWLGEDVTADRRYSNAVLSAEGLPAL